MLGVDPERVAIAEPCRDVSVVNDETWCKQIATVKQSVLFHSKHKERNINIREALCNINKILFLSMNS